VEQSPQEPVVAWHNPILMTPETLPVGTRIGHWRVVRKLGSGGFGAVYAVRRSGLPGSPLYALKIAMRAGERWFNREAETLARLKHPGVVRLVDTGVWPQVGGHPYLVQRYVDGVSLYEWARVRNPTARQIGAQLVQVLETLSVAHHSGVLHRDFKGNNAVITPEGRVVILDWGSAWYQEAPILTAPRQPPPSTALYSSPRLQEYRARADLGRARPHAQMEERYVYSVKDELYAVGVTFFRLLTDEYPTQGAPPIQVLFKLAPQVPREVAELNPRVPQELCRLIFRMLNPDRFLDEPTARELARELRTDMSRADAEWDVPLFDWRGAPSTDGSEAEALHEGWLHHPPLAHRRLRDPRAVLPAEPHRKFSIGWRDARVALSGLVLVGLALAGAWWIHGPPPQVPAIAPRPPRPPVAKKEESPQSASSTRATEVASPLSSAEVPIMSSSVRSSSSLKRCATLGATALTMACAGSQNPPSSRECPHEAKVAMRNMGVERNAGATLLDIRYPAREREQLMEVKDGPVTSRMLEAVGDLPKGTLLKGRLWVAPHQVIGWYTEAETPDGMVYPVCFVLGNPFTGWSTEVGPRKDAIYLTRISGFRAVNRFE
jgi:eukaryotic-like serine/threonine-protein kinase